MAHPSLALLILAAGAATRMRGRDKLLEEVDGLPLLRRQARLARAVTHGPVIVALPPSPHPRYDALQGEAVTLLPVPDAGQGMSASIRRGITALPKGTTHVMILLGDMPDITESDLRKITETLEKNDDTRVWRGATETGKPGHPIVFHHRLFAALTALTGDSGAREVVAMAGENVQLIPLPGTRARLDLDTPEDWATWRANRVT